MFVIPDLLSQIQVRCVTHLTERRLRAEQTRKYHDLPFKGLLGPSIYHVAELNHQWLALIGWLLSADKEELRSLQTSSSRSLDKLGSK